MLLPCETNAIQSDFTTWPQNFIGLFFATHLNGFVLSYLSDIFARPHAHSFEGHPPTHPASQPSLDYTTGRHPLNVNDQLTSGSGTTTF